MESCLVVPKTVGSPVRVSAFLVLLLENISPCLWGMVSRFTVKKCYHKFLAVIKGASFGIEKSILKRGR